MKWVLNMQNVIYENIKEFKKSYPKTVAWRLKQNSSVIERHLNDDEVVLFTFAGQKDTKITNPFYTTIVVFTNKRMILGRKMFLGRYYYYSITPDMLNDFEIKAGILFGSVEVDTIKEHFVINCIDKNALVKIEDALSKYMQNEKIKLKNNNMNS